MNGTTAPAGLAQHHERHTVIAEVKTSEPVYTPKGLDPMTPRYIEVRYTLLNPEYEKDDPGADGRWNVWATVRGPRLTRDMNGPAIDRPLDQRNAPPWALVFIEENLPVPQGNSVGRTWRWAAVGSRSARDYL